MKEILSGRLFCEEKIYEYLEAYASSHGLNQTLSALPYARTLHQGQFRKGIEKVPYIYHPLTVACHALALGFEEDDMIAAALLHDVCEDCGVLPEELPVNEKTKQAVAALTKSPLKDRKQYFEGIAANRLAIMVKLLDRCNNISGMAAGFSDEKMWEYIEETECWIYPLFDQMETLYPEYSNQVFLIRYHMSSVIESLKRRISV